MGKAPSRRLKVFVAQIGFYDTVVAAASQAAALKAWGTRQNLFAGGEARLIDDAQAVEAALANPEMPLRRAVGTDDPFELHPRGLPAVPDAPSKSAKVSRAQRPVPPPEIAKPPADRSALDEAEAAVRKVDEDRRREEAELRARQDELDAERDATQAAYIERRKAVTGAVVEARQAYRNAGGSD